MLQAYECYTCHKVSWFFDGADQTKCSTCGGTSIKLISAEQVDEGQKSGAYFNIDLSTGKRAKPKRRR